jgi:DNA modification methylase
VPALEARILVEAFCPAGGTVLDPMCGSGTVLLAASTAERRAIGIEIDRNHYLSARARIADALRSR